MKLEPEEVSEEKLAKREVVREQLQTALTAAQQQRDRLSAAAGESAPSPVAAAAPGEVKMEPADTAAGGGADEQAGGQPGTGGELSPMEARVPKGQAAAAAEVEAAENLKKREMDLAKLAMTEASSNNQI